MDGCVCFGAVKGRGFFVVWWYVAAMAESSIMGGEASVDDENDVDDVASGVLTVSLSLQLVCRFFFG